MNRHGVVDQIALSVFRILLVLCIVLRPESIHGTATAVIAALSRGIGHM